MGKWTVTKVKKLMGFCCGMLGERRDKGKGDYREQCFLRDRESDNSKQEYSCSREYVGGNGPMDFFI